jgi:hypothetical protein
MVGVPIGAEQDLGYAQPFEEYQGLLFRIRGGRIGGSTGYLLDVGTYRLEGRLKWLAAGSCGRGRYLNRVELALRQGTRSRCGLRRKLVRDGIGVFLKVIATALRICPAPVATEQC